MRSFSQATTLLFAGFSTLTVANELLFKDVPSAVAVGEKVNVTWTSDSNYTLQMLLVQKTSDGWEEYQTVFTDREMSPGSDSYVWEVPTVDSSERYALWLDGTLADGTGYADLTSWWKISGGKLVKQAFAA